MRNFNYKNFTIHYFDELESTNSDALRKVQNGEIFINEIIMAGAQKSGRGRLDRSWDSPKGNLYFSLVLRPQISLEKLSEISFLAAVALRLALEKLLSVKFNVQNKWPNDILIDDKKIAGILLESDLQTGFIVLGVGVNISSNPENVRFLAANLKQFDLEILPEELLQKFLDEFEVLYQNYLDFGFKNVRNLWLQKAFRLNEKVRINLDGEVLEGVFKDIDLQGNLLLEVVGNLKKISVADMLA